MTRTPLALLTLTLAIMMGGCLPNTITINLDDAKGPVRETAVLGSRSAPDSVAQIDLVGVIGPTGFGLGPTASIDDLALMLRHAKSERSIKAVLLRIDSPGGGVGASETLHALLQDFRDETGKPVVVSMGNVAASGGYYVAMAGDTILAQPSSVTGSVGVIIPSINAAEGLGRIGITSNSITSGPNKDLASPVVPVNPEHQAILQSLVDDFYDQFRSLVLERRPDIADPDTTLDGRVFTGRQALEAGLIDELGGIPEAFDTAKDLAGLDRAKLVKLHRTRAAPATPYAGVTASDHTTTSTPTWPVPTIERTTGPGVYYLWLPPGTLGSP